MVGLIFRSVLIIVGAAVVFPISATAQSSDGKVLEEIIVTAQKREQYASDVGIAVTAFSGQDARRLGFLEPVDVATQTPNLNINNTFSNGIPNVSIRGIGLNDYAVNNNPPAGIYIDDIYLVSPAMLSFQLFDLESIEVLRGPQGTLYGKNTTAGTVKFVSRKSTVDTEGYLAMDVGRYERVYLEGAVGGMLTPELGVRIAAQVVQQGEGFQFNRTTTRDVGEVDRYAWRAILDWRPAEAIEVRINLHSGQDRSDPPLLNVNNILDPSDDVFFEDVFSSAGAGPLRQDVQSQGGALSIDWAVTDEWSLTSVTGYEDYSRFYQEDRDGSALVHLDGFYDNEIEQFSQELRATYISDPWVLILGGFIGSDQVDTRDQFDARDLLPLFGLAGATAVGNFYRQDTDTKALFAHSEWQFNSRFRLNLGLRYTDDRKEFSKAFTFIVTPDVTTGGGFLCALRPLGDPAVVAVPDGVQTGCFPPAVNDYDVGDVSGKVGIDFTGIENTLIYATASKGFKSGGFQGQLTFNPADLAGFDEENLYAYEVGLKTQFGGGRAQLNAAAFLYDFEDLQFYGPLFDSPFGPLFGIANAGDAEVRGAEFELVWLAGEGLDVRLGLGLLDTEITTSILPGVAEGSDLPNSPEINFNTRIDYRWALGASLTANVMLALAYKDDVTYDIVRQPPETREEGYWLANARLSVDSNRGNWSAYLWGRNLTDERYRTQVLTSSIGFGETWGTPFTYGIGFELTW
ncbi:MAG: TonB-dependent receptor [Bryobacterales bacterium]|nr:TonB-dependent receptor [Bryobacterales bacterium]